MALQKRENEVAIARAQAGHASGGGGGGGAAPGAGRGDGSRAAEMERRQREDTARRAADVRREDDRKKCAAALGLLGRAGRRVLRAACRRPAVCGRALCGSCPSFGRVLGECCQLRNVGVCWVCTG
jgi:hypothetical protein